METKQMPNVRDMAEKLIKNNPDLFNDVTLTKIKLIQFAETYKEACIEYMGLNDIFKQIKKP